VGVRVGWGMGTGSPGIPQGYPRQSLEYFGDDGVVEGALTDSEADDEEQEAAYFNMV